MVAVGSRHHLCSAGSGHGGAEAHVVGKHQRPRLPDHIGKGRVGLFQRLGVGVDGIFQTTGAGGDIHAAHAARAGRTAARGTAAVAYVLFGAAQRCPRWPQWQRPARPLPLPRSGPSGCQNGSTHGGGDRGQQAFKGCTDRADQGSDARKNGGEAGQQTAAQALTDGESRRAQRPLQALKDRHEGGTKALCLLPDLREAAGQAVHDLPAKVDSSCTSWSRAPPSALLSLVTMPRAKSLTCFFWLAVRPP